MISVDQSLEQARRAHVAGDLEAARRHYKKFLASNPNNAVALCNLGTLELQKQNFEAAERLLRKACKVNPAYPLALGNLSTVYTKTSRFDRAAECLDRCIAYQPDFSGWEFNAAQIKHAQENYSAAEAHYKRASQLAPNDPEAFCNLASLKLDRRDADLETIGELLEKATQLNDTLALPYVNLARLEVERGDFTKAEKLFHAALERDPDNVSALFNFGLAMLKKGNLEQGWPYYHHRHSALNWFNDEARLPDIRPWKGESIEGRNIFVWREQGLGDEIIYASMVRDLIAQKPKNLFLECSERLVPVFSRAFPEATVISYQGRKIPKSLNRARLDYQICICDLGPWLRPTMASFPDQNGYLCADPDKTATLRQEYQTLFPGKKLVGVSWKTASQVIKLQNKSSPLVDWAPILENPACAFINLQYGKTGPDITAVANQLGITIHDNPRVDPLIDMDTAFAEVAAMDLVITTSSTTAHTAGSMGLPVWIMLPYRSGLLWYWFLDRPDSPWYPSARLFRQQSEGDWHAPINDMAAALREWT